jgi:hypothetical protein
LKLLFCLPGREFSTGFLRCWTTTIRTMERLGVEWLVSMEGSSSISHLRNKLAGGDPEQGEYQTPHRHADYTHQVWIDSDQIWSPEQILRLVEHDLDVVSGCIRTADGDYALHRNHERLTEIEPGLFEVDSCGFGFVVIKRQVFEQIPYPWFRLLPAETGLGDDSEDVSFCRKVRAAGMKVVADGDVKVGHEKLVVI